ncbi:MAG: cyclic nucleotide-binding domain-containing protein [Planctomycetota bacterium]|jgi:zinc transporter ZupT
MGDSFTAFGAGLASAVSLPLGAALGLWLRPGRRWTSSLMAFGGGALLAALTLELAAHGLKRAGFAPVCTGFVVGALLFMGLNRVLNGQGAFLRKSSTTSRYLLHQKRKLVKQRLARLAKVPLFQALPPEEFQAILQFAEDFDFDAGETIFEAGEPGDRMYIVEAGKLEVLSPDGERIAELGPGDVFGEMALLTERPRSATVRTLEDTETCSFDNEDFDQLMEASPALSAAVQKILGERLDSQVQMQMVSGEAAARWMMAAEEYVGRAYLDVDAHDIRNAREEHSHGGGAAMAIWLGILLDSIPESIVIGGSAAGGAGLSLTLIVGVFLANFPEALSSAVGMREQGSSVKRVMLMWTSLMVITGLGAWFGFFISPEAAGGLGPMAFTIIESVAAGAMLAMIAETMLPEAMEQGGPATGLMTVLGFLAAVYVSTLSVH